MDLSNHVPHPEPLDAPSGALQLMSQAARDGAADAQAAAERVWSAAGLFVCRFVYTTCYTVSYGVVFPSALLARSLPNDGAAVRGFIDGASAAVRKVDEMTAKPVLAPSAV